MMKIRLPFLFLLCLLLAGCSYPIPTPLDVKTPVSLPATPTPLLDPAAPARLALAARLNLPADALNLVSVEAVDWPDGCLGIYEKDVVCTEVIVPGYRLVFENGEQRYEVHADHDGSYFKELPVQPALGAPLLVWRSAAQPCTLAHISARGAAVGACAGSLMVTLFTAAQADELAGLAAAYAPAAGETPAGSVEFGGSGPQTAGPGTLRALAEWAAFNAPAPGGMPAPNQGLLLAWKRSGGIAGFCNELYVYRDGFARSVDCRSGASAAEAPRQRLDEVELVQLYAWADAFQTSSLLQSDGAVADSMTTSLEFYGQGGAPLTADDQGALLAFCSTLYVRLAPR